MNSLYLEDLPAPPAKSQCFSNKSVFWRGDKINDIITSYNDKLSRANWPLDISNCAGTLRQFVLICSFWRKENFHAIFLIL